MSNLEADPQSVAEITTFLLEKMDEFLRDKPRPVIDCFMAAHAFHIMMAQDASKKWKNAVPENHTLRMADMTFRKAIRELRLPSSTLPG